LGPERPDMKPVPHRGPINIRCRRTKFRRFGARHLCISAPGKNDPYPDEILKRKAHFKAPRHTHHYTAQSELSVDTKGIFLESTQTIFKIFTLPFHDRQFLTHNCALHGGRYHRSLCNIDVVRSTASTSAIKRPA
jgi:hypothetical protein